MRVFSCLIVCLILVLSGCSNNNEDYKVQSVDIQLTKQNNLDNWKLSMVSRVNTVGQQGYGIEFQYTGNSSVKDVTVYYRVDTKEKLSGKIVKADSKTIVSKLEQNEKITLSDINLPVDTPISVAVNWLDGNYIKKGSGTFEISEVK